MLERSVSQFSRSVVSDSLRPHALQHTRPPCPSPTPRIYSNSCPLSWWCHLTMSSSFVPFSSCLQSFPASGSFPVSQFFTSGGQSIGVSASASVLPMNIQDWFPLGGLVGSPCRPRNFQDSFPHCCSKASILQCSAFFIERNSITSIHDYWEGGGKDSNTEQSRTRCLRTPPKYGLSCNNRVKSGWSNSSWCLLGKLVHFTHTIIFFWKSSVITVYHKLMCPQAWRHQLIDTSNWIKISYSEQLVTSKKQNLIQILMSKKILLHFLGVNRCGYIKGWWNSLSHTYTCMQIQQI